MRWASALSGDPVLARAIAAVSVQLRDMLRGEVPDLLVAFVSPHYATNYDRVPALIAAELGTGLLLGCSAGGVIGAAREREDDPGVSVTAAVLPDVALAGFHLGPESPADTDGSAWRGRLGAVADAEPSFLILADPFSTDAESAVQELDRCFPGGRIVGGLASGGQEPAENALWLGGATHRSGLVGVAFGGDITIDTVVAQGCRPIGEPMFVSACHRNILRGLDGRPAIAVLQDLFQQLDGRDQELFRHSLFLGLGMEGGREEYQRGDFLVRNIIGMDTDANALAIGAMLREGQVVQFQLRDAATSAEDLDALLGAYVKRPRRGAIDGALLFSCLGRGKHLYGRSDHDTDAFRGCFPDVPLGGFFCNGEIGPVRGTTFLHGYTSAFGLFRKRS